MSRVPLRLLGLTSFTFCIALAASSCLVSAADRSVPEAPGRIDVSGARRVSANQRPAQPSMVARAAKGQLMADPPLKPLRDPDESNNVKQVGFLEDFGNGCGPVCDCAQCSGEPACGTETMFAEPACGLEAGCGTEMGCGLEPGCGLEGCDTCCEPACTMATTGDCGCDACCTSNDYLPLFLPILRPAWCRFDFFAGTQGYTGPMNHPAISATERANSGSFGFYQGFNEGRSLKRLFGWDMAAQLGARATQSNLSGTDFSSETRNQVFVTGGLFRRVDYGLQYGLVVDYLNEDWYYQADLVQLRGELSWRMDECHEFGFKFMAGVSDDTARTSVRGIANAAFTQRVAFEPTDQYRLFYRRQMQHSGNWEGFVGWTDNDDGILGASLSLPLRRRLVLQSGATYLIPNEGSGNGGEFNEGWNISLGLVFRPGGPEGCGRYCRPMFDVADNGTFMVDRR